MFRDKLKKKLRFCVMVDVRPGALPIENQLKTAMEKGVTCVLCPKAIPEVKLLPILDTMAKTCRTNNLLLMVVDNILLARSLSADAIILDGPSDELSSVRSFLGPQVMIGKTITSSQIPEPSPKNGYDFLVAGPFKQKDAEACLDVVSEIVEKAPCPVIYSGPISATITHKLASCGVTGMITDPLNGMGQETANAVISTYGAKPRSIRLPWRDEFGLIKQLLHRFYADNRNVCLVPPGDDAAALISLAHPVITTDTQREGVHFRTDWQTFEEIGEKAVSVTLSDLAASYAYPMALFINLSLPETVSEQDVTTLYQGIHQALKRYNCALGGGNISRAKELGLDLFAIGECYSESYPTRSSAREGENVYVTGPIGLARAGLLCLSKGDPDYPALVHAFKHPSARFDAARILYNHHIRCVMDISDGLLGDVAHIAEAATVTIRLDLPQMVFPPQLTAFSKRYQTLPERLALQGGEDYELIFTCMPHTFNQIKKNLPSAFQVGTVEAFSGTHVIPPFEGSPSFQHGEKSY